MEPNPTPKPGSKEYDPEKTPDLNIPKYHSSTERRKSHELPSVENLDDAVVPAWAGQRENLAAPKQEMPETDLGNDRDNDEEEREKLISP